MVTVKVQPLFWMFEFRKIVLRWDGKPYSACVEFFWESIGERVLIIVLHLPKL